MRTAPERFRKDGLLHEIVDWSEQVPVRLTLRCGLVAMPQFGGANLVTDEVVTCLQCLGTTFPLIEEPVGGWGAGEKDDGDGWGSGGGGGLGG